MRQHLIVAGVALGMGVMVGVASHLVARVIALDLVAPIFIGMGIGAALSVAVRRTCYARPRSAAAFAVLAVIVVMMTHMIADYVHARARQAGERAAFEDRFQWALLEPDELSVSYFLAERFGFAEAGPDHRLGASLGPPGILAISGLELLIAVLIAALWARAQAREPACPACRTWRVRYPLGRAALGVTDEFVARLAARNGSGAARLLAPPDTPEYMQLALLACRNGHDDGGGLVRVIERRRDRRQRWRRRHVADVPVARRVVVPVAEALGSADSLADLDPTLRESRSHEEPA